MKKNLGLFLAIILVQIAPFISAADTLHPLIYKIDIKKEISNTTRLYLSNGLAEAYALGADAVLIHMNTYGGQVDAADSMRTAILYNPIPVYVFIDNNAASAGALISIACKKNLYAERCKYRGSHRREPNRGSNARQIPILYAFHDAFDSRSAWTRYNRPKKTTPYTNGNETR